MEAKPKKEKFRKYQYTKPYKDRDRTKDFGKDLPLKKSGRLKFPEKPQYYTLYTVPKLKPDHPFFNIRNKDIHEVKKMIEQTKKELEKQNKSITASKQPSELNKSQSFQLRSSAFETSRHQSKSSLGADQESNRSSLGVVTISNLSNKSKSNPFSQGFAVTSGPKVYAKVSEKSEAGDVSKAANTPLVSVLSGKEMNKSTFSDLSLSGLSRLSDHLSL